MYKLKFFIYNRRRDFIYSFFLLFVLSTTSIFFLFSQSQFNAFAIFTVERNDYNEDNEDSSDTKAKIILIEQKYKSDRFTDKIIGKVKNIGNGTAEYVKLTFNLYNKRGELIETEFTYSDPHTLKPGQKAPFDNFIDEKTGDKVKAFEVSLSWDNPDGTEEYIENVDKVEDENIFIFQEDEKSKKLTDEEIEELGLFER